MLPGLGDDHRLFRCQTESFPDAIALDWIDVKPNERLEDYAKRFADSIPKPSEPTIVCGLSLGGMAAPFFARQIGASAIVLLATVRSASEFPNRYYWCWILSRYCPLAVWGAMATAKIGARLSLFFPSVWQSRNIDPKIVDIFSRKKTTQLARQTRMMLQWAFGDRKKNGEGATNESIETNSPDDIPIVVIHGDSDRLIPVRFVHPDIIIQGAGHLPTLTHHDEINNILRDRINLLADRKRAEKI